MKTHRKDHPIAAALLFLFAVWISPALSAGQEIDASRSGDELVVTIDRFDLLRQAHRNLNAVVKLRAGGNERELRMDFSDPAVRSPLVIDLAGFGRCDDVTVTVNDGAGKPVATRRIAQIPEIPLKSHLESAQPGRSTAVGKPAYIEPGAELRTAQKSPGTRADPSKPASPQILLPDLKQLRTIRLATPKRLLSKTEIKFPVVADIDYPLIGGVIVGRQTAAPKDTSKASLYFSCKKAIYDGPRLERWQKFLLEIPIQDSWGQGQGDESITLSPAQFEVHLTNERSPGGKNILNEKEGDLGQLGEFDSDEQGRIYWRIDGGGGAYVVRFNPHTRKFEQPPAQVNFQKLVPPGAGLLNDGLTKVSCTRGRVYFTMCNDTLASGDPRNPLLRRIGGVFSIPQDWSNATAFLSDIRLHVGSWETAQPTFYKTPPKADAVVRKLGACSVTEAGLFITTADQKYEGGPWRLDLDEKGNNKFFGVVKSLEDTVAADGTRLSPTKLVTVKGIPQGRELNVGSGGGRNLAAYKFGEVAIPRASVRLLTRGVEGITLIKLSKHVATYEGAPKGTVTLRYDMIGKIRSHPEARGALADSLNSGSSMGPAFLLSPIPGETGRIIAVCEYAGYPLSILDISRLHDGKMVRKSFLPPSAPASTVLGPYNSVWVNHADEQWLYVSGYVGMSRIQYSKAGKALSAPVADLFNSRLTPQSIDGHGRTSMKKIDGLLPVFGGRLLDSGYGLDGRGGDAFSTGVELFDPHALGSERGNRADSRTSAYMSRCFALKTLHGRVVWNARDGSRHQEIFAASGSVRRQIINELKDPSVAPANLDAKIFLYDVSEKGGLRDLFGFSLPKADADKAVEGHIALSPCNRFLVIMTWDGVLYTYSIARRQFMDGAVLQGSSGAGIQLMEFKRPSRFIFAAPDGQIFFLTEPFDKDGASINFNRVTVCEDGRLGVEPHLGIAFDPKAGFQDFKGIVHCFSADVRGMDGSYDLVLGYGQHNVEPFVRVITDFIAPDGKR